MNHNRRHHINDFLIVFLGWGCTLIGASVIGYHGLTAKEPLPWLLPAAMGIFGWQCLILIIKIRAKRHASRPTSTWSMTAQSLWINLIPALLTAVVLVLFANGLIEYQTHQTRIARYQELISALLDTETAINTKERGRSIQKMPRFQQATPFGYFNTTQKLYGLNQAHAEHLKHAIDQQPHRFTLFDAQGYDYVWRPARGFNGLVGIQFQHFSHEVSTPFTLSVVFVAIMGSILVTLVLAFWSNGWLLALKGRIDHIPHGKKHPDTPEYIAEIHAIGEEIKRLESRFLEMHQTQIHSIETGHRTQEMKAQFFAGMSHDLRSPLNSVLGFTDLLLKGSNGPLDNATQQGVTAIAQESEKLIVLIADILDTAKLNAVRFELAREWVPSVEILTECKTAAQRLIGNCPIQLTTQLQAGLPPVYVDKDRIRQAIVSLVSRAITAMESGCVALRASREAGTEERGTHLRIDIIDAGHTIPQQERRRIQDAFRSIEGIGVSSGSEGLKLGIALANDIVQLHYGNLVALTEINSATVFTLILPLQET